MNFSCDTFIRTYFRLPYNFSSIFVYSIQQTLFVLKCVVYMLCHEVYSYYEHTNTCILRFKQMTHKLLNICNILIATNGMQQSWIFTDSDGSKTVRTRPRPRPRHLTFKTKTVTLKAPRDETSHHLQYIQYLVKLVKRKYLVKYLVFTW